MLDNEGRLINYLRVSVTDLCNLRCKYCMPEKGICKTSHKDILRIEEIEEIIRTGTKLGIKKVRLTGGEPLVRKGIFKLISNISKFEEIKDIAITTNGILLKKYAKDLKKAGLNRVNISIDTLNPEKYKTITRGGKVENVLEGIRIAKEIGLTPIKLNIVLIGGFNDDEIQDFLNLTMEDDIDVRFIELMPIGEASTWSNKHFIPNTIILKKFSELIPLSSIDDGSPAKYYKLPKGKGKIGFINPISSHFCSSCNRIRITSEGKIKPCLHSDLEIDIKKLVNRGMTIEDILRKAIVSKPKNHRINSYDYIPIAREMYQIGG